MGGSVTKAVIERIGGSLNLHCAESACGLDVRQSQIELWIEFVENFRTQVGLAALFIFQHVFKAKFELLGIKAEMNRLRCETCRTRVWQVTAEPSLRYAL
jgi:hypothetical protein